MQSKEFYRKFFGIENPYDIQESVWNTMEHGEFPIFIKAPTGSGKTEAVIAPFLNQFVKDEFNIAPRLIYVLPMRVLVNTVADRIRNYCNKISPYISVKVQHRDTPDSPFFISDIVVTTLDQFVYGFSRASSQLGHHIDIPAGAIASSIVVFDEAHMYRDEFTFSVMRAILEILQKTRIPFVIMTATMPESLEKSLFEREDLFKNLKRIISYEFKGGTVKWKLQDFPLYDGEECNIPTDLLEKIKRKKTLIVLNQVKRAQKVYRFIKDVLDLENGQIVLLHSRFTKRDRIRYEKKALSIIPHKKKDKIAIPEGIGIVVSTQVLEAGIDFSAELLLTELAPADSLIQRIGRCARYKGQRGEVIIFPLEDDKGWMPYKIEHIDNTLKWLKHNPAFDFKNFSQVLQFVDETLDYHASDYEARDTLIDLYECVLYADTRPTNIQVREGKPITLVVVDPSEGEGRGLENRLQTAINKMDFEGIREASIEVDFKVGITLLEKGVIKYRIDYNPFEKRWKLNRLSETIFSPFGYYLLDINNYRSDLGVEPDGGAFI